jgi:release factor glutamine methyltransferase
MDRLNAGVSLLLADQLSAIADQSIDVLVSNPPYIDCNTPLGPEVASYDPKGALYAGDQGLAFYHMFARQAPRVLRPGGLLAVEIGYDQGPQVLNLLSAIGESFLQTDLDGNHRVIWSLKQ